MFREMCWLSLKGMLNKVILNHKYEITDLHNITLTGTAAISVGFRTLVSPLLPFFILVDWKLRKQNQPVTKMQKN